MIVLPAPLFAAGLAIDVALTLIYWGALLQAAITDCTSGRLPDPWLIVASICGIGLCCGQDRLWEGLGGAITGLALFGLVKHLHPDGIGLGDVKLMLPLGLVLESEQVWMTVACASVVALIVHRQRTCFPFGPYLIGSAFIINNVEVFI